MTISNNLFTSQSSYKVTPISTTAAMTDAMKSHSNSTSSQQSSQTISTNQEVPKGESLDATISMQINPGFAAILSSMMQDTEKEISKTSASGATSSKSSSTTSTKWVSHLDSYTQWSYR